MSSSAVKNQLEQTIVVILCTPPSPISNTYIPMSSQYHLYFFKLLPGIFSFPVPVFFRQPLNDVVIFFKHLIAVACTLSPFSLYLQNVVHSSCIDLLFLNSTTVLAQDQHTSPITFHHILMQISSSQLYLPIC